MPELATYQQKPPRIQALQWTGDPDDAAWIVEQYGATMNYDAELGELRFTFPGEPPVLVPPGEWFVLDPVMGISQQSDEAFTAAWEPVEASRR